MKAFGRLVLFAALALPAFAPWTADAGPVKTAKDCNEELERQRAALEAAGEPAQEFFHRCWWESKPGQPTPVKSAKATWDPGRHAGRPVTTAVRPARPVVERAKRTVAAVERPRRYRAKVASFTPRYEPIYEPPPWRPRPRRLLLAAPPYGPPGLRPIGPPPVVAAGRPGAPIPGPLPRVCVDLGPLTVGVLRGRPCVPLPVGPVVDIP